ncbi:S41 family peptidase [Spirosoma linguale]|uniref:Peptidase S41 n=1 Tax=Spirosoma linguale (strain ATCC 33905 / DSM 74 / LMG 10896 / Claus 1) TaxID=504472 RepID=D2QDJ8_SPILD|nr:peptidase S41 [Spirosoma linguale DSM 74]
MKRLRLPLLLLFVLNLMACSSQLLGPQVTSNPVSNFEHLWQEYDRLYGPMDAKKIDWKQVYTQFRPQVSNQMTDAELYAVMTNMLDVLDDNHVYLRPVASTRLPWYTGGILGRTPVRDYDETVVKNYLTESRTITHEFDCGKLPGNVGYILQKGFENDYSTYEKTMDSVLTYMNDTRGLIIDLRNNGGGEDRVAQYIANRFASQRSLSFTARLRNGPNYSDLGPALRFYTEPAGRFQYLKPVVVLTNRSSFSSAETFLLAMLQNKQVVQVGDVTGGALSDAISRELPNGWLFRVSIADVRDASGRNLEGLGIEPTYRVNNQPDELKAGQDKALQKAISLLL